MSSKELSAAVYRIEVRNSAIHGQGVFAAQSIPANRKVIEYTGERISTKQVKKRGQEGCTCFMRGHILYMSRRKIRPGEELTVDYHFSRHEERVECHCKAKNCRRTINLKS
jgi:SET domain-containing protein